MNERIFEEKVFDETANNLSKNFLSINDLDSNCNLKYLCLFSDSSINIFLQLNHIFILFTTANLIQLHKSNNISSEKLFKLFLSEKTNRGYYVLLIKLNDEMNTTEYTNHKLNNFKMLLNKKLQEILEKNDFTNEMIINLIFNVLRKSYYLLGKDKNKSNISVNEQLANDSFLKKNSFSPQLNLQQIISDSSEIDNDFNNNINLNSVIEHSLNIVLKFLSIMDKKEPIQNEKIEKNHDESKDKGGKIFFLLSKNNNIQKNVNTRKDEIPINCMNFLNKFIEEPIVYENKMHETTTVNVLKFGYIFSFLKKYITKNNLIY